MASGRGRSDLVRVGFAGWGWRRGPQPERGGFFPNDELEDGRPLDPELPHEEVQEGQGFLTQAKRRWMPSQRRRRWWRHGASVARRRATSNCFLTIVVHMNYIRLNGKGCGFRRRWGSWDV